ncbi:MAG: RNA polymerase sigma factor [Chloroflexota bacterium]
MDEHDVIARLKGGDIAGLELLVRRYQAEAIHAAYLIARDRALAEDLVQAAFLRVYERIAQFDATRGPFRPWFLRIVVNDAVKACGRRERERYYEILDESALDWASLEGWAKPEELVAAAETVAKIRVAMEKLSPVLRGVIVERYFLELTEAEMAEKAARPTGTIKRRLHDARVRLRALLASRAGPTDEKATGGGIRTRLGKDTRNPGDTKQGWQDGT